MGAAEGSRVERVARALDALGLDALLVDSLFDVRYVSGFTGSSALVLVVAASARERLGAHRFLTDFRYRTQSGAQVGGELERVI
ncbi:MAG TPA: aminopeptidase P family N-terminal domain-containing protein, partial [Solirubrobacteraceae bacterium]|nr:aminopeptidase P family N-terminal domain-containing protein [Solirubrobacteraceae bacterium]